MHTWGARGRRHSQHRRSDFGKPHLKVVRGNMARIARVLTSRGVGDGVDPPGVTDRALDAA